MRVFVLVGLLSSSFEVTLESIERDGIGQGYKTNACAELCKSLDPCRASPFIQRYLSCQHGSAEPPEEHTCGINLKYQRIIISRIKSFVAPVKQEANFDILNDYRLLTNGETKIYVKYHHVNKTWAEALTVCQSEGGTLINLSTKSRQIIFTKLHKMADSANKKNPWIGLRRRTKNDKWIWTDGTGSTKKKMKWSFPFYTPKYDCVIGIHMFAMTKWIDAPCADEKEFICEVMSDV